MEPGLSHDPLAVVASWKLVHMGNSDQEIHEEKETTLAPKQLKKKGKDLEGSSNYSDQSQ